MPPPQRTPSPPPLKGSFPLDHFNECKTTMNLYMRCLKRRGQDSVKCSREAVSYLECRMKTNLMQHEEDLTNLGFDIEKIKAPHASRSKSKSSTSASTDTSTSAAGR